MQWFVIFITGSFDAQDIELGRSTTNRLCIRCYFLMGTQSKGCLLIINEQTPNETLNTFSIISDYNGAGLLSNWICTPNSLLVDEEGGDVLSYDISVFEIENDQTTTEVIPIDVTVRSDQFNELPVVLDDAISSTISLSIVSSGTIDADHSGSTSVGNSLLQHSKNGTKACVQSITVVVVMMLLLTWKICAIFKEFQLWE